MSNFHNQYLKEVIFPQLEDVDEEKAKKYLREREIIGGHRADALLGGLGGAALGGGSALGASALAKYLMKNPSLAKGLRYSALPATVISGLGGALVGSLGAGKHLDQAEKDVQKYEKYKKR